MFEHFEVDARRAVARAAADEAPALGSATIEEEHLLLALAADQNSEVGALLAASGLDHDGVVTALERETERSLAAVGVAVSDFGLVDLPAARWRKPRFATSSKRALERAVRLATSRGDRALSSAHLLVGVLGAEIGTVSRALAITEVDRTALIRRAERLLD
jgi:ATP-dependent Clp protease ATP-binding subunit ClpA